MDFSCQSDLPDSGVIEICIAQPHSYASDLDTYYRRLLAFELHEYAAQVQDSQPVSDTHPPLCLQDRLLLADRQHNRIAD